MVTWGFPVLGNLQMVVLDSRCWSPTYTRRSWVLICFDPFPSLSDDIGQIHNNIQYKSNTESRLPNGSNWDIKSLQPNSIPTRVTTGHIYIYYKWCTVYNLYSLFIIYIIHVGFHKTIESPFHILPSWPPSSSEPTGLFVFPFEISDGSISGRHLAHRCGFSTKSWEQKIARWCCVYILYTLVLMRRHHVQTKST